MLKPLKNLSKAEDELYDKWYELKKNTTSWVTRGGELATVATLPDGTLLGKIPSYPVYIRAGWSGLTRWSAEGIHVLSRTDDLIRRA